MNCIISWKRNGDRGLHCSSSPKLIKKLGGNRSAHGLENYQKMQNPHPSLPLKLPKYQAYASNLPISISYLQVITRPPISTCYLRSYESLLVTKTRTSTPFAETKIFGKRKKWLKIYKINGQQAQLQHTKEIYPILTKILNKENRD